jgi:hypothetical protein
MKTFIAIHLCEEFFTCLYKKTGRADLTGTIYGVVVSRQEVNIRLHPLYTQQAT